MLSRDPTYLGTVASVSGSSVSVHLAQSVASGPVHYRRPRLSYRPSSQLRPHPPRLSGFVRCRLGVGSQGSAPGADCGWCRYGPLDGGSSSWRGNWRCIRSRDQSVPQCRGWCSYCYGEQPRAHLRSRQFRTRCYWLTLQRREHSQPS